jgi:hypothetical protein
LSILSVRYARRPKEANSGTDFNGLLCQHFGEEYITLGSLEMTPKKFIGEIVNAYCRARIPLHPHPKLTRGESRSISPETEDLIAFYLVQRIPQIERIYINQPLTRRGYPRIKPDLVICHGDQMRVWLDVKIDLGWKRTTFEQMLRDTDADMTKMRGQAFRLKLKGVDQKTGSVLTLGKEAKYLFPTISDQNIKSELARQFQDCAATLSNVELYFLTRRCRACALYSAMIPCKTWSR